MNRTTSAYMRSTNFSEMRALEVSGRRWREFGFAEYTNTKYQVDGYDLCRGPLRTGAFDVVIAEQVLEHLEQPEDGVRNIRLMLRPGGLALITTPFLIKIHPFPDDYQRWTPSGLQRLLTRAGFPSDAIESGSWGNRACVAANLNEWVAYSPRWHSLRDDPDCPVVLWAFATLPGLEGPEQ